MKLIKKLWLFLFVITGLIGLASCIIKESNIEANKMNMPSISEDAKVSTDGINKCWLDMIDSTTNLIWLHTDNFDIDRLNILLNNELKTYTLSKTDKTSFAIRAEGEFVTEDPKGYQSWFRIDFYIHFSNRIIDAYFVNLDYTLDSVTIFESDIQNGNIISSSGSRDNIENLAIEQSLENNENFSKLSSMWFDDGMFINEIKIDQEEIYNNISYDRELDYLFLKMLSCTCILSSSSDTPYLDNTAPSIVGENIYINVDNPLTFEQIKSRFTAHDETDGDITSRLTFTDNTYILTNGKIACGTYSFKVSVSDNAGNTTTKMYYAHVVDYTDPTITGKTINVSYKKLLTEAEKKALFSYSDNYTPKDQLIFRWVEDKYTSTYQELGEHTLTAKVLDQQGNEATATSIINVIDDVAPFLVVPENLKITTLDDFNLDSFRPYVTVTDEKEGNITNFELIDLDDYLNHKKVAGTYRIKVVASDSSGNTIEKIFPFLNEDKDMPSIKIDPDYIMIVNQGDKITKEQVINYFIRTGQLTLEEVEAVEVASAYFEQLDAATGFYSLRLMTEGKVIESKIEVVGDNPTEEPTDPKDPIKPADNKFLSTEGYAENFFKPTSWSIYHYLTIVGIVLVIGIGIFVWVKKKD
ncbi:MAG TPA: PKD domain-containing protein [Candidatus Pelethenecus sp.]|nr:PKD domain-containing protein [Candidatus Pelethenecus sp.]